MKAIGYKLKLDLPRLIVLIGVLVKLLLLFKESFFLVRFEGDNSMEGFILTKASLDSFMLLSASIYFYETCYADKKLVIPIIPFLVTLTAGLIFNLNFTIPKYNILILGIVLYSIFSSFLANMLVILAKESTSLILNFFANGFEIYILSILIVASLGLDLKISFLSYISCTITVQLITSVFIYQQLKKKGFRLKADLRMISFIKKIPTIISSSIILLVVLITKSLLSTADNIVVSNYSIILATSPLLLLERFYEYSRKELRLNLVQWLKILILFSILGTIVFYFLHTDVYAFTAENKKLIILLKCIFYFSFFLPVFLFFIVEKRNKYFPHQSAILLVIGFSSIFLISYFPKNEIFVIISGIVSTIFLYIKRRI